MNTTILKNEKGVSLVLLALGIVVIFGFAALAIDIGHLYNVKNQLQVAADAAALAGASKIVIGTDTTQTKTRNEAQKIAALNFADVAFEPVPGYEQSPGAPEGQPIPVALKRNESNDVNGDIVVGNWDGNQFRPEPPFNAVKVTARRWGDIQSGQPNVQNWFAKIFGMGQHLGVNYDNDFSLASVSAVAIAAKTPLPLLPIAVNEYWDEGACDAGGCPDGDPYVDQSYPNSFMRQTNADGSTSTMVGNTLAIVGSDANKNHVNNNMSGYIDILYRNEFHNVQDHSDAWHLINSATAAGVCASCDLDVPNTGTDLTSSINNQKFGEVFDYLFNGIPDSVIPPNAVREIIRGPVTEFYAEDNYNATNQNDPSECPHATVPYFSSSGATVVVPPAGPGGLRFYEKWRRGDQFMVMVYDGTGKPEVGSQVGAVTIVGYSVIELDGYSNNPFNGDPDGDLDPTGSTAFGHVIPHGLAGEEDPYILQPTLTDRTPDCSFTDKIRQVQNNFAGVRLVDPSLKYGVHQQQ